MSFHFRRQALGAKKRERTRSTLIDSAIIEISKHGPDGASIKDICVNAGLATGTFYNYFNNLEELHATALRAVALEIVKGLAASVEGVENGLDRVILSTDRFIRHLAQEPTWGALFVQSRRIAPHDTHEASAYMRKDLERAQAQGLIKVEIDSLLLAQVIALVTVCVDANNKGAGDEETRIATIVAVLRLLGVAPGKAAKHVAATLARHAAAAS